MNMKKRMKKMSKNKYEQKLDEWYGENNYKILYTHGIGFTWIYLIEYQGISQTKYEVARLFQLSASSKNISISIDEKFVGHLMKTTRGKSDE